MRTRTLGWVGLLLLGACIPETHLQPRPDARSLAGEPSAAVAESAGVRLIADGAAWNGNPSNLERRLTPVEIRLENHSGRALKIRYTDFDLLGESHFQYAALAPTSLQEVNDAQPSCVAGYTPGYWSLGLGMGWTWGPHRGWRHAYPWGGPWWPSPYYSPFYDPFYGPAPYVRCEEPLPTQDMMERALPEGTLQNGGTVSGFLYFQGVGERERQVTLQAQLVDADTGERFSQLTIPFQVHR
jgi:hypothetical protein